jgi:hypothetical protein
MVTHVFNYVIKAAAIGALAICASWSNNPPESPLDPGCKCLSTHDSLTLKSDPVGTCTMTIKLYCGNGLCPDVGCAIRIADCETNGGCCGDTVGAPVFGITDGGALVVAYCQDDVWQSLV